MRLIIQAWPPHVGGRGVLEELFFDHVFVEPGDGAQPPGDGGAGAAPGFQVPGEAFDVGAPDGEQVQGAGAAPGGELAQVQGIRLAGQAAVSGQKPGEREPLGVGEDRLDRGEGSGWGWQWSSGTSGAGLRPGGLGQLRVPAIELELNVNRVGRSHHVTTSPKRG
jgi:hypothetical protein